MSDPATTAHGRTILLVEDDDSVRYVLRQSLAKMGFQLREARNGAAALEMLDGGEAVDLVVTDVVMPLMGGFELATHLARRYPGVRVLLISGYTQADGGIAGNRLLAEGTHFLRKPFSSEALSRKLDEILGD